MVEHGMRIDTESFFYVILAVSALVIAPVLHRLMEGAKRRRALLDGFVIGSIALLVMGHVLPDALKHAGGWALLAGLSGLILPLAIEGLVKRRSLGSRLVTIVVVVALSVHAFLDGVAVQGAAHHPALGSAVAIHKLSVGLMIWTLVRPKGGALRAWGVLLLIAAVTCLGVLGPPLLASPLTQGVFGAFVGGALLHVVGSDHSGAKNNASPQWELFGAVVGCALVWGSVGPQLHWPSGERLLALLLETAPSLVLGFVLAGVVVAFLPQFSFGWLRAPSPLRQAGRGVLFGLPIPICSCGVVPIYEGLVRKGAPISASMAFLVATPELGLDSLLLSLPLLGPQFTSIRLVAALVLALTIGAMIGSRTKALTVEAPAEAQDREEEATFKERLTQAARYGLKDVVDDTAAWILLGLVAAAWIDPDQMGETLLGLPPGVDVLAAALAGIPLYVCASGATPLAAALLLLGLSPGAALALLLAGPATNVTTFGVLSRCHGIPIAVLFGAAVFALSVALGLAVNATVGAGLGVPGDLLQHPEAFGLLSWLSLGAVLLMFGASLWRLGPRGFMKQVVLVGQHDHDHDHTHGHHHHHHGPDHHHHEHCHHDHGHHDPAHHKHGPERASPSVGDEEGP